MLQLVNVSQDSQVTELQHGSVFQKYFEFNVQLQSLTTLTTKFSKLHVNFQIAIAIVNLSVITH